MLHARQGLLGDRARGVRLPVCQQRLRPHRFGARLRVDRLAVADGTACDGACGGTPGDGAVFELSVGLGQFVKTLPTPPRWERRSRSWERILRARYCDV